MTLHVCDHRPREAALQIWVPRLPPSAISRLQPNGNSIRLSMKKRLESTAMSNDAKKSSSVISPSQLKEPSGFRGDTPKTFATATYGTERIELPTGKK